MDDVMIVDEDPEQYDVGLVKVLEQIKSEGLKLNCANFELSKPSLKFVGHCVSKYGGREGHFFDDP